MLNYLSANNTYFALADTTLYLPDHETVDIGSIIRLFKREDVTLTIEGHNSQLVRDLTTKQTTSSYTYNFNEELRFVFDGTQWLAVRVDNDSHRHTIAYIDGLQDALDSKQDLSKKGEPNGYASLNSAGTVPPDQLPSYVDDVLEYSSMSEFPASGETGKIYTDISTGRIYRWSGSTYVEISSRPPSTDDVPEGSSNLYFTEQRARDSISNGTGVIYDSSTGEISIGQSVGTNDNVTFNQVTADLIGNVTGQVSDISNHTTDDLTEGTVNLYFTEQRARDSLAAGTGVTYDAGTGTFSIGQEVETASDVTFNQVTADLIGNVSGQVSDISNHTTDDLTEGSTNQYFTAERVDDRVNDLITGTSDITITYDDVANTLTIGTTGTDTDVANTLVKRSADNTFEIAAIDIDTNPTTSRAVGRLRWSQEDEGPEIGLTSEVNLQVGQEQLQKVINDTGFDILPG